MIKKLIAEGMGTLFLLATVVGSGIMAENLADGNVAIALLGNTIPTGAILVILILVFGPISGAHFNPAVTLSFLIRGEIKTGEAIGYVTVQIISGIMGVILAHLMFDLDVFQLSDKLRSGRGQWISEVVATFGLVMTILGCLRFRPEAVPYAVGLYITAAYWFTASTSFANPAVTMARTLTGTFSGINPADAPFFIMAQIIGAILATIIMTKLLKVEQ
jgi:glycerol uptake facilitator-like aquaporin